MGFYIAGKDFPTSPFGWTYCLSSDCGQYIKIGKTSKPNINERLRAQGRNSESIVWAISDQYYEGHFHNKLGSFRCLYVEGSSTTKGSPMKLIRSWDDHKTREEMRKSSWIKSVLLSRLEVFHITPNEAKTRLKKAYPEAFE